MARSHDGTVVARFSATVYVSPRSARSTSEALACASTLPKRASSRVPFSSSSIDEAGTLAEASRPSTRVLRAVSTAAPRLPEICTAGCGGKTFGKAYTMPNSNTITTSAYFQRGKSLMPYIPWERPCAGRG